MLTVTWIIAEAHAQTTFHGGNERVGVYESQGIRELKGVKWKFHTGAPVIASPALSNGVILVGSKGI